MPRNESHRAKRPKSLLTESSVRGTSAGVHFADLQLRPRGKGATVSDPAGAATVRVSSATSQTWPSIPVNAPEVTVGRLPTNTVAVEHASVSRNHLKITNRDGVIEIEDLDSRFGTFVNGARIRKCPLHVGDTVRIGSSPPYRFNGQSLECTPDGDGMTITLRDVMIERDGRRLIEGINFTIEADSFVGVLGPSGAGKSLMLGTLSSTIIPTAGSIEFDDGRKVAENLEYYRSKIGLVTQDDLVYVDLTVRENLEFAAVIRLPDFSPEERAKRVDHALKAVGLLEHQAKRVGVLSGGQRKRVSVAIELLLQPRLLLLDEPTSGLDPGMQATLMETLRGLARTGVTIVCTTHTLDTLNFFDRLIVLGLKEVSDGAPGQQHQRVANVVYYGPPAEMLPAFGVHTQMDLFDRLQRFSGASPAEREAQEQTTEQTRLRRRGQVISVPRPEPTKERLREQAEVVFKRAYYGLTRDRMSRFMAISQPLILAILVALSQANQLKVYSILFFTVVCSMWLGMTLTVREVVRERKLYIRDRIAGLHPDAYLVGKLAYAMLVVLVQNTLLWGVIRFIAPAMVRDNVAGNLRETSFLAGWFILILTGAGATLAGLVISTLARSERAAVTIMPLVLLPQVVLSRVVYGDIRKLWTDPSPYCAMLDFVKGKPLTGEPKAERDNREQLERLRALEIKVTGQSSIYVPPPRKEAAALGRGLNFLLSLPMLSRPAGGALDMLSAAEATSGMFWFEFFYLIILVSGYGGLVYWSFHKYEKTWNDIRSA